MPQIICEEHQNQSLVYEYDTKKYLCSDCLSLRLNGARIAPVDSLDIDDDKYLMSLLDIKHNSPMSITFCQSQQEIKTLIQNKFRQCSQSISDIRDSVLNSKQLASLISNTERRKEILSEIRLSLKDKLAMGQNIAQITLDPQKQLIQQSFNEFKQLRKELVNYTEDQFNSVNQLVFESKRDLFRILQQYNPIPISFTLNDSVSSLVNENGVKEYKIKGKNSLLSIERIPVDQEEEYQLKMEIKNCSSQVTYLGWGSFYGNEIIYNYQAFVKKGTEVKLTGVDEKNHALIVDNSNNNLSKWNAASAPFNQKYLGYYKNGDINSFITKTQVITSSNSISAYQEIDEINGKILLTKYGWTEFQKLFSQGDFNKVYLMNHYSVGGSYDYNERLTTHIPIWTEKTYTVKQFRNFTQEISVCILADYDHQVNDISEKIFEIRNVTLP